MTFTTLVNLGGAVCLLGVMLSCLGFFMMRSSTNAATSSVEVMEKLEKVIAFQKDTIEAQASTIQHKDDLIVLLEKATR